jgi:4-azaleucine resistance transporter AzlC
MERPIGEPQPARPVWREFWSGARDQIPILVGVLPAGLIFGALGKAAGLASVIVQGFSFLVFAGSAQFVALGLIVTGAPPLVIILAIFIVNLRHALYSATFSERLAHLPLRWKVPLSWLLTDEAFAVASVRFNKPERQNAHWYLLGTGLALWGIWQLSTAVGIGLGAGVPDSWHLDFALPLTFLALLTPSITDGKTRLAAAVSAVVAVGLGDLPYRAGLMVAVILSVGVAAWAEGRRPTAGQGASHE